MKQLLCTLLCALLALAALPVLAEEAPVFLLRQSDYMKSLGYEAVSYTHLDVYKRQRSQICDILFSGR